MIVEGELARLSYHTYEPHVEAIPLLEDGAMAWAFNILRELCGSDFRPSEVSFVHGAPIDRRPYRNLFKSPISFNSAKNGLYFPADMLNKPLKRADAELHRLLQIEVNRLQARFHDNFLDHFKSTLHSILWVRHATIEDVAILFSVSSRTLNRRLNAYGTTFIEVADEVRCQISCQILTDTEIQLTELAKLLHFFDASSFIKAFKRWTGKTPAHWRASKSCHEP